MSTTKTDEPNELYQQLDAIEACEDGLAWFHTRQHQAKSAWETCSRLSWLWWLMVKIAPAAIQVQVLLDVYKISHPNDTNFASPKGEQALVAHCLKHLRVFAQTRKVKRALTTGLRSVTSARVALDARMDRVPSSPAYTKYHARWCTLRLVERLLATSLGDPFQATRAPWLILSDFYLATTRVPDCTPEKVANMLRARVSYDDVHRWLRTASRKLKTG